MVQLARRGALRPMVGGAWAGATNVGVRLSTFVGRARELAALVARVRSGPRLTTVFGPGGVGKTRLALEAARAIVGDGGPAGGVWVLRAQRGDVRGRRGTRCPRRARHRRRGEGGGRRPRGWATRSPREAPRCSCSTTSSKSPRAPPRGSARGSPRRPRRASW